MSTMNRLGNAGNRYQTEAKRVLCLCSAGLLRSPTAANVLHKEYGYNTRAAGVTRDFALIPLDEVLLHWADEIVCVEQSVADALYTFMQSIGFNPELPWFRRVAVLAVPDMYQWNDPKLRRAIKEQYALTLGSEFPAGDKQH